MTNNARRQLDRADVLAEELLDRERENEYIDRLKAEHMRSLVIGNPDRTAKALHRLEAVERFWSSYGLLWQAAQHALDARDDENLEAVARAIQTLLHENFKRRIKDENDQN